MSDRLMAYAAPVWLALLGLSISLSILAAFHDTLPGDSGIASWLQDLSFPGETLADLIRSVTQTELLLVGGGALALLLWLRGYRRQALIFAAGLIILPLLQAGIKEVVDRPRPSEELVEVRASFSSASFPSGHVMGSAYFYGFLLYLAISFHLASPARVTLAVTAVAILLLSGPANVWLGVHWPSDVLGGYAWGATLLTPVIVGCRRSVRRA